MGSHGPVNLLLVDDRPENLLALEAILRDPAYHLVAASSGPEALHHLANHEFALILLDVQMPGMDGFDTARRIRQHPAQRDVPIIFITAINKDPAHIFQGYESGAIDYIMKPFDDHVLRAKVAVIAELYRKNQQIKRQEHALLQANAELQKEIQERRHAETALRMAQDDLERRVHERTAELASTNENLRREIVERARVELALRESEDRFRILVEGVKDYAIFMLDPAGHIISWNTGAQRIVGYQADEILGKECALLYPPQDLQAGKPALELQMALATGRLEIECSRLKKGGERFWANIVTTPLHDSAGRFCGFAKVIRDITEWKLADQRLRAALNEKEVLLKEIHHRVKNNLQIISSLLSLQARRVDDPSFTAMFKNSCSRIKSMALLHESLYQSQDLAHIAMDEYLRHLVEQLKRTYDILDAVTFSVQAERVFMEVDPAISCALIINELVANALEHAFPDGRQGAVRVELSALPNGMCMVVVSDDGIGLPAHVKMGETRTLGLTLVSDLTEQLNGVIALDNRHGTQFTITVPLPATGALQPSENGVHLSR